MTALIILYIICILATILFSAFFSGFETAVICANKLKLKNLELDGDYKAEEVLDLLKDAQKVIAVTLVGVNINNVLCALISRELLKIALPEDILLLNLAKESWEQIINLALLTPILLIFSEVLPKQFSRQNANLILMYTSFLFKLFSFIFIPIIKVVNAIVYLALYPFGITKKEHHTSISKEDIKSLVGNDFGVKNEKTEQSERKMIHGIFNLEKTRVCEVMRPLPSLVAVRLGEASVDGVLRLARDTGYSKFPVFRERIINIIGFVDIYRIFSADTENKTLHDFLEEAPYVPESKRIDDLLQDFIKNRIYVAIVVDEYGGCSGWVTRKDLLEEIVGEIKDEFIKKETQFKEISPGVYEANGALDIDDLNETIPIRLEKNYCETVGGYIYSALGRIPALNEKVEINNYVLEVIVMEGRKIKKIRISALKTESSGKELND